jgi:tRNA-dihydrouridine synthase
MLYTEFISSELDSCAMRRKAPRNSSIYEDERPVGIQIFGGEEEAMSLSAKIVERANPELLDINYGCPVKKCGLQNGRSRNPPRYR